MEKEHIKKLLYSFLKGKEYLNKTVISQNLSIIDEVIESSEQNKSVINQSLKRVVLMKVLFYVLFFCLSPFFLDRIEIWGIGWQI